MKKILIQELTALLERQAERAAEADKRLERLERLLYREPSAGTGTGTTAGVSESGAERGAEGSVGPAAAARRTVCLPASATPAPHLKSASTCKARVECSVRDSETGAVSRLEDSEPTLRHAVTHAGGDTCRAAGAICRACGEPGHFEVVCHQRASTTAVAPSAVTRVRDSPGVALVAVAAGTAVSPPPADTGQAGHTALQPTELSDAADAYGASPPPAGAQSTRPAAAYGASPPPAGGLPTRTRDGGTAAGYAVSPLPGDTSQADCCAAQPTELSETTDVYGASPPPAGGMPTRSTDGGPAASTAESPPPAGTGQAGCSHAAQPTELTDAYGASPPLAGDLPVRSGDGDPSEQMVAAHAAALLRTPQGCVPAGGKSDRRGDTNLGDTTLHSVEVVDDLLGPTVDDEVWEDAEDPLHAAAVAAMLAERDTECDARLPPLVDPSLRVTRAAGDRDPWPPPTPERRLPRTSPCDGGRVRCKKRPRRRGRERRRRRLHRAAVALCARTPEGLLWRLGVKTM
ncbi:skin secretory protein xP2-like [Amphibalanus amphitrite]|uniref:skin secretory protein xP2-like n=1 Tax=Amphibalanus amphitrite TaxID=1232801 RepID=UPI001C923BB3|nr:skin secretory protein xP2-like [Amphibalanus amphitrite]